MSGYVSYLRVSTQQQGQSGLGLAAQKDIVLGFLGNNTLLAEYVEVESGKCHKNRPELLRALEECRKKKATLVIAKLDRLSRSVAFISSLMDSDIDFVCCDCPQANRFMLHMLAAFAEHEREIISERIKAMFAWPDDPLRQLHIQVTAIHSYSALPFHILRLFIHEPDKAAMAQVPIARPFCVFKLAYELRFQPDTIFHLRCGEACTPPALFCLRQIGKGAFLNLKRLHLL
jgi:hypothetical protein